MLYSLREVRADRDRREEGRRDGASFWARYSDVLRTVSEQPRVFGHHSFDGVR